MKKFNLITCIVQRGRAEKITSAALKVGASGVTYHPGRGTGVRQTLGKLVSLIIPEKEIVLIVTKESQTDTVFDAIVKAGKLDKKGYGIIYTTKIERTVGFVDKFQV
jgi:nitrogen regulatory protein P-II 1